MSYTINNNSSFLLVFALLSVFTLPCINACGTCVPTHKPPSALPSPKPTTPSPPLPSPKPTTPSPPLPSPKPTTPSPPLPSPKPTTPSPPSAVHCPRDALKLGVCADLLGLAPVVVGKPTSGSKCCALLDGLVDLEAALCLCTAIKANVLGIKLDVPVALSVVLRACQKHLPSGFTCK